MRVLLVSLLLLAFSQSHAQSADSAESKSYKQAVSLLNSGKIVEARQILEKLVKIDPPHYRAHRIYWMTVGRTEDPAAQHAAVRSSLERFAQVEPELRDEDFYWISIEGHEIHLSDQDSASQLSDEAVRRFPRGLIAQQAKLEEASEEKDPLKAAGLYQAYLEDFDENVSWTQLAARDRFGVMAKHPELFDVGVMRDAAEELERRTLAFIEKFGNPYRYVHSLRSIAEALMSRDAPLALAYIEELFAYIQKMWPRSEKISEKARYRFWPLLLRAHLALENWEAAIRVGRAFLVAMDGGAIPRNYFSDEQEASVRKGYAQALQKSGMREAAEEQLELAAALTKGRADPLLEAERSEAEPGPLRERRDAQAKQELLATQRQTPAYKFSLPKLGGGNVSLEELNGNVVVVSFWATWCVPCVFELTELEKAYDRYGGSAGVRILAVSIDSQKDKVEPFVRQAGYRFPILLSNGTVEVPYKTPPIPKLHVIDSAGNIRCERLGFASNGYFQKELDWMIAAARQPFPPPGVDGRTR